MAAKTYRKTALVTAEQFLPAIGQIPKGVYADGHGDPRKRPDCKWVLDTKEGRHDVRGGDYICTGPAGEQWNVAKEIFEATYEEAETPSPQPNVEGEFFAESAKKGATDAVQVCPECDIAGCKHLRAPRPPSHVAWTQADAERENAAFTEWFKQRRYPDYPDIYPLTTENAMHSAWQEAAKRAALAATEGKDNG